MAVLNPVDKFYRSIMEEVLQECREMFLDDGVDEIVLTELKQMWEKKVKQSKVFEFSKMHTTSSSFGMGSYGIISSSRNTCQEILVPSIQLAGPRGGLNNNYTPTATIALPYGLYQQQISALNSAGISLQPSGNGQFLAFIRPDQQRLQSVTTPQGLRDTGKARPIIVSTSTSVPIRPDAPNLNRASTSLPANGGPDLKKQNILPTQTVYVGRVPNGSIAVKGTGNLGYSQPVIKRNNNGGSSVIIPANKNLNNESSSAANLNPTRTEQATTPNVTTNTPISNNNNNNNNNNNVSSDINIAQVSATTDSNIDNTENLKTASTVTNSNNSNVEATNNNNTNVETPVSSTSTTNTFNTIQNIYPPSNASSDTNTAIQKPACDNSSLEALANICPTGFYNETTDNSVDTRGQTGMVSVQNDATSLEDFMDNITNSNESYNYPNANDIMGANSSSNMYNTQSFPGSMTDSSLSTNLKPATPGGQMCRFSEEDMQTIDEILQFDGAADEYTLEDERNSNPSPIFYGSSPAENNVFYNVNNPKMIKFGSESFYENGKESIETKDFVIQNTYSLEQSVLHRVKTGNILKKDRLRFDYLARKKNTRGKRILPISTVSRDSNQNLTTNDQGEYYLETNIQKIGSSPENKKSQLSARNVFNQELVLNSTEKNHEFTKETRSGISARTSSLTSNSSAKPNSQLVPQMEPISTINTRYPNHRITPETVVTHPQIGLCSFPGCLPRQFDGEDADSSSSSDDNANANDNDSGSDDDDDDDDGEEPNEEVEDVAIESEPLNSADDDSDIDICAMFESENIVVCQFEKISRNKNKWKFHLKDGIMNLFGRDLIFSKSIGEAEW